MIPRLRWIAVIAIVLATREGFGATLVFSGSLEKLTAEAISILLPDGIIIEAHVPRTGPLSAESLAEGRYVGDLVELTCETISPRYDERAALFRHLELKGLKPSQVRPKADSLAKALSSRVWREPGNLLKPPPTAVSPQRSGSSGPSAGEAAAALDRARSVNLALVPNMPNFVADENVRRFRLSAGASGASRPYDTFLSEITVQGSRETRQDILRDGKRWTEPYAAIPGFRWFAGFGTQLTPLFLPTCPTSFEAQGRQQLNGKQVWVYRFRSQADGCFGYFDSEFQRFYPELAGRVFIDEATGNLVRYEERAVNFPAAFFYKQAEKDIVWNDVQIEGRSYLLPISARFLVTFAKGDTWSVDVNYTNHRHFEVSSKLIFGQPVR